MPTLKFVPHENRRGPRSALALMIVTVLVAGAWLAPSALADSVANLKDALAQARGGTTCGALHVNPIVEQAATKMNHFTDDWLNHIGGQVPPDRENVLTGLKILGYRGNKAYIIQGAGKTDANAIKGALLEGYNKIPDCSYTEYGASMMLNERTGEHLSAVVLAGP